MPDVRRLICLFHLNLAYSSLEEEGRAEVVRRCYWPMLELARRTGFPIAIEASGWTFEQIEELSPEWISACRSLLEEGCVEIVGSGWAQIAGPLVPAEVNVWNLRLGLDSYERLFGRRPRVALLPEQAYSRGLVDLFAESGYDAIIADWDNAYRSHQDWPASHKRYPQRAVGCAATLPVIWSQSIAFQKFQRYAHAEMSLDEYVGFVAEMCARGPGALMLYANDAEIFDNRPGRFVAEPPLAGEEWKRIEDALREIADAELGQPALPSEALALLGAPEAGHPIRLEAPPEPIPVKKQDKYNIGRWACTGRDDAGANSRCWRIYHRLRETGEVEAHAWRELCELWASDFRTHITERRWHAYLERIAAFERRVDARPTAPPAARSLRPEAATRREGNLVTLACGDAELVLNVRRGLAVHAFTDRTVAPAPLVGTIPHGWFETIDLGADWYTGTLAQEAPHRHKVTDLGRVQPEIGVDDAGRLVAIGHLPTELGVIRKVVALDPETRSIEMEYLLDWQELPPGSLRLGYVTLMPDQFDERELWFATHNGGRELERFELDRTSFDHGQAVSALVSSRQGLGATEGVVEIGDGRRVISVTCDRAAAAPLALLSYRSATPGFLLRLCWSLTEEDDTRRGAVALAEPRVVRLRVTARRAAQPASSDSSRSTQRSTVNGATEATAAAGAPSPSESARRTPS